MAKMLIFNFMEKSLGRLACRIRMYYFSSPGSAKPLREDILRAIGPVVLAVATFGAGAAYAAWSEHPYKDLGFVVEFANPPMASTGNYRTQLVDSAPVHLYTQKHDGALFIASVTDLQNRAGD